MKISAIFFLIFFCSCSTSKIYLVRHAEKAGNAPTDGLKSPEGTERVKALTLDLHRKILAGTYSTNYPRTIQTAKPLAEFLGLPVSLYNNGDSLLAALINEKNKNFLVVGHSNTVPQMIRAIGLDPGYSGNMPDNQFDNLYIITIKRKNGKPVPSLEKKKYGAPMP